MSKWLNDNTTMTIQNKLACRLLYDSKSITGMSGSFESVSVGRKVKAEHMVIHREEKKTYLTLQIHRHENDAAVSF